MEPGEALAALQAAAPVAALRASGFAYPLVNTAHVLGLALLYGSVVAMDLAVVGVRHGIDGRALVRALRPLAIAGLLVAVLSGATLFAVRAVEYAAMPLIWAKLALIAAATTNALLFVASEHIPPGSKRSARREHAQAFEAGAISDRPDDSMRSESTLEHIPLGSKRSERQEYAQAFESGAISCRPDDSIWSESALAGSGTGPFGPLARLSALLSLALWTAVVVAGRFVGYGG